MYHKIIFHLNFLLIKTVKFAKLYIIITFIKKKNNCISFEGTELKWDKRQLVNFPKAKGYE